MTICTITTITILIAFAISFLLTFIVIPRIVNVLNNKKIFDEPNNRNLNKIAIPTTGGIAIFFGWIISSLLCLQGNFVDGMQYLFIAILMMFFMGIRDDIIAVRVRKKFTIQICAALLLVIIGDFRIINAHGFLSMSVFDEWLSIPLSVLLIIFLINAINLIDGIDGLCSGLSIVIASFLGIGFYFVDCIGYAIICFALIGSLAAFLRFNLSKGKNRIFMGDTGSLILGVFLSTAAIYFSNRVATESFTFVNSPAIILALFIVPVTDTLSVFFFRIRNKRSPFKPDMNHIHHLLIKRGMTHIQGTCFLIIYTLSIVLLASISSYYKLGTTINFFLILSLGFIAMSCIRTILSKGSISD